MFLFPWFSAARLDEFWFTVLPYRVADDSFCFLDTSVHDHVPVRTVRVSCDSPSMLSIPSRVSQILNWSNEILVSPVLLCNKADVPSY